MRWALIVYVASIIPASLGATSTSENVTIEYFLELINSRQSSWRAGKFYRANTTTKTITHVSVPVTFLKEPGLKLKPCSLEGVTIPETFDARTQWPECADSIGRISNQGLCDSCWAFAATGVMSDRLCIQTGGKVKFDFSAQELVSCCQYCGNGCGASTPTKPWDYYLRFGIVSGGGFTSLKGCKPYQESEYFYNKSSPCLEICDNPHYNISYKDDKHFGSEYYLVNKTPECIQAEIMKRGPVQAMMSLHEDFAFYKEGVYFYTVGKRIRSHAVRIVGWGTENGLPYWLGANSWGCQWGSLGGFFKISRGHDESAIEQYVVAGNPKSDLVVVDEIIDGPFTARISILTIIFGVLLLLVLVIIAIVLISQKFRNLAAKYLRFQ